MLFLRYSIIMENSVESEASWKYDGNELKSHRNNTLQHWECSSPSYFFSIQNQIHFLPPNAKLVAAVIGFISSCALLPFINRKYQSDDNLCRRVRKRELKWDDEGIYLHFFVMFVCCWKNFFDSLLGSLEDRGKEKRKNPKNITSGR